MLLQATKLVVIVTVATGDPSSALNWARGRHAGSEGKEHLSRWWSAPLRKPVSQGPQLALAQMSAPRRKPAW